MKAARELKRKHRVRFEADPKAFRAVVKTAFGRVFRVKPGPKQDPRVADAARARAQGAEWPELYRVYIDYYSQMPEFTRALAEEGFRRKVNLYQQRHRRLRRRSRSRTAAT